MKNKNFIILSLTLKKGGSERVISLISKHLLNNNDISFHIVLLEGGIEYDMPENVKIVDFNQNSKSSIVKFLKLPLIAFKLFKYIKNNNIDVVMSFLYRPNYINLISKIFGSKHKAIINIRSTTSRYKNEGILGKINLFLVKYLFNKSDLIISNSCGVDEDLKSIMKITTKTKVIYNPIDLIYINNKKDICEDIDFKFYSNKKYIISVGRLIPLKRNFDLIKAFFELQKEDDTLEVLFLGDGILKNDLINECVKLQIENKVHFLGNVMNPFYYLSRSDLFVMTSETEGFPNVLIEAMACGLPVISSDCKSGPNEILENGKFGLLYTVGNISELIDKMRIYLYSNNFDSIIKKNRSRLNDFTIEKKINEFISMIKEEVR